MSYSLPGPRRATRVAPAFLVAAAWLVLAPAVFAQGECHVSVEPASGRVGTVFTVTGEGFGEPTIVTVSRNGREVSETEVELAAETGSFSLDVRGDAAGSWLVRAILPESECGDEVEFSVLPDTSTVDAARDAGAPVAVAPLLLLGALWVLVWRRRAGDRVASPGQRGS